MEARPYRSARSAPLSRARRLARLSATAHHCAQPGCAATVREYPYCWRHISPSNTEGGAATDPQVESQWRAESALEDQPLSPRRAPSSERGKSWRDDNRYLRPGLYTRCDKCERRAHLDLSVCEEHLVMQMLDGDMPVEVLDEAWRILSDRGRSLYESQSSGGSAAAKRAEQDVSKANLFRLGRCIQDGCGELNSRITLCWPHYTEARERGVLIDYRPFCSDIECYMRVEGTKSRICRHHRDAKLPERRQNRGVVCSVVGCRERVAPGATICLGHRERLNAGRELI